MSYADGLKIPMRNSQTAITGGDSSGPGIYRRGQTGPVGLMKAKVTKKRRASA